MPFEKGDQNINREGRPKGSPNKTTQEVRDAYQLFAENNMDKFQDWIDKVASKNPAKALEIVLAMSEYFLPKLQRTETDVTTNGKDINIPLSSWADDKEE
jgi:hypothetical protein